MILIYRLFSYFVFRKQTIIKRFQRGYYPWLVRRSAQKCGNKLKVNAPSSVNRNTFLGENVNFNGMTILGDGKVEIGDNFHSGTGCKFITSIHNYEGAQIPYDSTMIDKDIKIGDNVWLGDDVIVLGGVTIGEGAIIQAGSVVVSNVPDFAIAGGHPAKMFKNRNKEHYLELKGKKLFL